jgi:hypothetical protein
MMYFWTNLIATVAVLVVIVFATPGELTTCHLTDGYCSDMSSHIAFIITAFFIILIYVAVGVLYNTTSVEIKRVDSVTK